MNNYICSCCGAHLDPGEKCDCKPSELPILDDWGRPSRKREIARRDEERVKGNARSQGRRIFA